MVVNVNAKPWKAYVVVCKVGGEPKPQIEIVKNSVRKPGVDAGMLAEPQ